MAATTTCRRNDHGMGSILDLTLDNDPGEHRARRRFREGQPICMSLHSASLKASNRSHQVIYSQAYVVLATFLTTSCLSFTLSLSLFYKIWPSPPPSQKFAILLELYFLSWIFLVIGTVGVNNFQIGGAYLVTTWNFFAWLAAVTALIEAVVRARWAKQHGTKPDLDVVEEPEPEPEDPPTGHRFVRGIRYEAPNGEEEEGREEETDPTEITPLMQQQRRHSAGGREYIVGVDNRPLRIDPNRKRELHHDEYLWWIAQMLLLIPLPTILLFQVTLILVHSLRNTLADGSSPVVGAYLHWYAIYS